MSTSEQDMRKYLRLHEWTENRSTVSVYRFEDPEADGAFYKLVDAYELELARQRAKGAKP